MWAVPRAVSGAGLKPQVRALTTTSAVAAEAVAASRGFSKAKLGAVLTVAGWAGVLGLAGGSVAAEETMSLASLPGDPGDAVGLAVRSSLLAAKREDSGPMTVHVKVRGLRSEDDRMLPLARAPLDVVAVVDRSGSMAGAPIALVKHTLSFLVENVTGSDRVGVVSFSSDVQVNQALAHPNTPQAQAAMEENIAAIKVDGATNISAGLFSGLAMLVEAQRSEKREAGNTPISALLLLTDGMANAGMTSEAELVNALRERLASVGLDVIVHTFGYGDSFSPDLLDGVAAAGNGVFYSIDDAGDIPFAFADSFAGLLSVVAERVKVRVIPAQGVTVTPVSVAGLPVEYETSGGGFLSGTTTQTGAFTVDYGPLSAEEERDLMLTVQVPTAPMTSTITDEVYAAVEMSYYDPVLAREEFVSDEVVLERGFDTVAAPADVLEAMDDQLSRIRVAEALDQAQSLADAGKMEDAKAVLQGAQGYVQDLPGSNPYRTALIAAAAMGATYMASRAIYNAMGRRNLVSSRRSHLTQRSTGVAGSPAYSTNSRTRMASKMGKTVPPNLAPRAASRSAAFASKANAIRSSKPGYSRPGLFGRMMGQTKTSKAAGMTTARRDKNGHPKRRQRTKDRRTNAPSRFSSGGRSGSRRSRTSSTTAGRKAGASTRPAARTTSKTTKRPSSTGRVSRGGFGRSGRSAGAGS